MIKKYHRIHLRLNEQQYAALKEQSKNAGMTMNKFILTLLIYRTPEIPKIPHAISDTEKLFAYILKNSRLRDMIIL